jgi:hypothetical protein
MDGIAIFDSGNYALRLCSILEKKGYVFEVIATPCHIAKSGCGYSLRFPLRYMGVVLQEARMNGLIVREIYRIENQVTKNKYVKIYP